MKNSRMEMFEKMPIWKLTLKLSIPSIIIMSIIGLYSFSDSVLSINFAWDSIELQTLKTLGKSSSEIASMKQNIIRQIMSYSQPTFNLLLAITLLFTVGVSTRVSINLGRGDKKRAINTIKTGMFFGILLTTLAIPLFVVCAKPWTSYQLSSHNSSNPLMNDFLSESRKYIIDQAYKYIWILSIANPIYYFSNLVSSLFRVEGRMKEAGIAMLLPVFFNLFMDWLFMGPLKMGIEGAALATAIADVITFVIILGILVHIRKDTIITFGNMFGKFNWKSIIGILIVGISPFFRNLAQSITGSVQQNAIGDVNQAVYSNVPGQPKMKIIITSVLPIYGLFFPMLFGFVQGISPIAGFNYGAKNIDRVKLSIKYAALYSFIFSLIIYALAAGALTIPLLKAIKVSPDDFKTIRTVIAITMLGSPLFVPAIGGMILFTSTDRILFSFISSTARGFIIFFPVLFIFKALSISYPQSEFLFWWMFPSISLLSGLLIFFIGIFTWNKLEKKHKTLDERIQEINDKLSRKKIG
ncbi:MAG: hypothetical protein GY679_02300 [Mycoplasma sp.]|nr:hypothetical protein [Mycoplasma sp.]